MKYYSLAFIPLLVARFDRANAQSDGIASTELPSLTSSSLNQCMDSDTFRWNDIDTKGCEWLAENELRRERLCEKGPFQNGCPQTCRKACCENDKDFSFVTRTGSTKNCFWLGKQRDSKLDLYCNDIVDKVLIKNKCPIACGACANEGSSGPSISPMDSGGNEVDEDVSSAADNGKCLDDGDFFVNSDPTKTCSWISKRTRRSGRFCEKRNVANKCRQTCRTCCTDVEDYTPTMSGSGKEKGCAWLGAQNRCDKVYGGFVVENKCPVSCGLCVSPDTPSPSTVLTTIPTKAPTTKAPTNGVTTEPTVSPSTPPSSIGDNDKCLDDGDFFVNNDPTKTCSWISKKGGRSDKFCDKTNVANKCRQTCRTCCTDVEDYTPTMSGSGKEKGCAWLGAQNRCDKRYDGFLVRNKCPVSCGLCDPSAALTIDTEGLHSSENLTNTTQAPTMPPSGGMNSTTLAN